jgi:hypothetical protein
VGFEQQLYRRRAAQREVAHVIEDVNPYDGSTITRIQRASAEDVSETLGELLPRTEPTFLNK